MRERKYIKLKVNMYEDTKFKIIDMKPERDLIHYIWTRFITLAGKVNLEGKLYMSKNIPYTIETLAIEFNREAHQVKLALDVFVELEMIERLEDNVYIVKNFVKHQNIKVKEIIKQKDKEVQESRNKINVNKVEAVNNNEHYNLEIENKDIEKNENRDINKIGNKDGNNTGNAICDENININLQNNIPIVLETKRKKKESKKKKNIINLDDMEKESEDNKMFELCGSDEENEEDEEKEDDEIVEFYYGDEGRPLKEGESIVANWLF